jgi:predicted PurR-regulated permease PerM
MLMERVFFNHTIMKVLHFNTSFFFALLLSIGLLMYFILKPFLTAILVASLLAILFGNWYRALLYRTGKREVMSASITLLLIAGIIITPLFVLLSIALNETSMLIAFIGTENGSLVFSSVLLQEKLQQLPFIGDFIPETLFDVAHITNFAKSLSQPLFDMVQTLYFGVAHFIFWLFVMFFTLFYFLIDGKAMLAYALNIMPLRNNQEKLLIEKFVSVSRATVKGTLAVSALQGALGGVAFAIAGVPSPVMWGLVMMIFSVIPMIGAGIIWLPAGIILLLSGQVWQGTMILIFGFGIISTIDNILRPKLVGKDTEMHPLMIFFATLGGISFFGFAGFLIGPIVASLTLALLDIYALEFREQLRSYNE